MIVKVKEFCEVSGKNEFLHKCPGIITLKPDEARLVGPDVFVLLNSQFPALILSENLI